MADADFVALLTQVLAPIQAARACVAPEHGVTRDAAPQPLSIALGTHLGDSSAPLVTDAHGEGGIARAKVGHVPPVELHVCAADADAIDFDDDLARLCDRFGNVGDGADSWSGDDEGAHAGPSNRA